MSNTGKRTTRLKNLQVNEVSFVDRGACGDANILLYKRKDCDTIYSKGSNFIKNPTGESPMTLEELQKQLTALTATVTKQGEDLALVTKERDDLKKAQEEAAAKAKDGKWPPKKGEEDGEMAAKKNLTPEELAKKEADDAIKKQFEDMEKRAVEAEKVAADALNIAKAEREARELLEYSKRAETEYPNIGGTPEQKGEFLKAIGGLSQDMQKFAKEMLTSHNEAIGKSFHEYGSTRSTEAAGPLEKLNSLAKAYQEAHTDVDYATAYSKVLGTPEGSKLYGQTQGR